MRKRKNNRYIFIVIKGSSLKKFVLLDIVTGTGLYYILKIVGLGIVISSVGSFIGTEGLRKYSKKKSPTKH